MFSHYATCKISPICKISTYSEDLSLLNPTRHLKVKIPENWKNFKRQLRFRLLITSQHVFHSEMFYVLLLVSLSQNKNENKCGLR